ncbi:MAG: endonuclease III [Deltaproteobacteria bacterium]|nr:MAG: endonuclease III [Deltaproteobacteria bacterium]
MSIVPAVTQDRALILEKVVKALEERYGIPGKDSSSDPLEVLISTVLSQNTNDQNRDLAYEGLKQRFPQWEAILEADLEEIAEAIKVGGLSQQKAGRIKDILHWVRETWGRLSLSPICELGTEEATEVLLGLRGVGFKTAYCVLAFGCGRGVFPVDTHILRITKRLGLIAAEVTAEKAHGLLAPLVPTGRAISLHLNLIRYGREICRARQPRCGLCFFPELCTLPVEQRGERGVVGR